MAVNCYLSYITWRGNANWSHQSFKCNVCLLSYPVTSPPVTAVAERATSSLPVYQEVWFIVVVAIVALVILFVGLALCIRCTGHRMPYIRERAPLQPRQRKAMEGLGYFDGNFVTSVSENSEFFYLWALTNLIHCLHDLPLWQTQEILSVMQVLHSDSCFQLNIKKVYECHRVLTPFPYRIHWYAHNLFTQFKGPLKVSSWWIPLDFPGNPSSQPICYKRSLSSPWDSHPASCGLHQSCLFSPVCGTCKPQCQHAWPAPRQGLTQVLQVGWRRRWPWFLWWTDALWRDRQWTAQLSSEFPFSIDCLRNDFTYICTLYILSHAKMSFSISYAIPLSVWRWIWRFQW